MGDILTNAKEIYFKPDKNPITGANYIVPVRGVYVTGEYKPPMDIEPILHLKSITAGEMPYANLIDSTLSYTERSSVHLYDIDVYSDFYITNYSSYTAPSQTDVSSVHLYDIELDDHFQIDNYASYTVPNQTEVSSVHLYDIEVDSAYRLDNLPTIEAGSQPESILHLTEIMCSDSDLSITNIIE